MSDSCLHYCEVYTYLDPDRPEDFMDEYSAIDMCNELSNGEFWVGDYWEGNRRRCSRVNFCPYCGAKSPNPIKGSE